MYRTATSTGLKEQQKGGMEKGYQFKSTGRRLSSFILVFSYYPANIKNINKMKFF